MAVVVGKWRGGIFFSFFILTQIKKKKKEIVLKVPIEYMLKLAWERQDLEAI